MKNAKQIQLLTSIKTAREQILKLSPAERAKLEKGWDVEHAYYSSVLEGSDLDRKEFETLAKKIA